ncbi:hypothetical protein J6590_100821 [Homalodisca vitripennis]|nr:hypothetical protein J6590_100821 [Homalodisca vitripennis]
MESQTMDVEPTRIPKRKERINALTGVFLRSVYFLDSDLSKCVIVGFVKNRGDSLGVLFKELAIVGNSFQCQIIFKPPFPREQLSAKNRTTAHWLEDNYHKISWEEGDYPYRANVLRTLCKPFAVIYTRGLEKAEFLRKFHGDVRELDDIVCEEAGNPCSCKTTHRFACSLPQHTSTEDPNVKCAMIAAKCRFEILNKQLHNTK